MARITEDAKRLILESLSYDRITLTLGDPEIKFYSGDVCVAITTLSSKPRMGDTINLLGLKGQVTIDWGDD